MKQIINWDEYFMGVALLSAHRSKDPRTKVGACIVNPDKRIMALGYNGMPRGCEDTEYPWGATGSTLEQKYAYVVHAELNAILNATSSLKNCTIYVALFPCNECAKAIIQSGIKRVVYLSDKYDGTDTNTAAKRMFSSAGVAYDQMKTDLKTLTLDFNSENV